MQESDPSTGGNEHSSELTKDERKKAAELIQRTYRGHRTRRELNGFGLDPTTRWVEAVREAQWRKVTAPREPGIASPARQKWHTVSEIARKAGADDSSSPEVSTSEASDSDPKVDKARTQAERAKRAERKAIATDKRKKAAKMMDLQYFLEMVDHKHRYGSNLRKYHAVWKTKDTQQNFFYWLDQGEGKDIELEECSRQRLDSEQVRYLSREQRLNYLINIDEKGQLRWAKNGKLVWTKDELFRDSVNGIVPTNDPAPEWKHNVKTEYHDDTSDSDSESSAEETEEQKKSLEGERYVNEDFHRAKGASKLKYVSAGVLFNHMIRQSLKKGHKWIYVADTNFRLYVGYKQSGAFQHSSFLQGARILSAGLIKIKDGQLRRLSPLSGHYRPPAANFRAFVHSLETEGCDMSHVSISRSYAILVGLEGYVKTRRRIKNTGSAIEHQFDKAMRPEKVKAEEEAAQDHSKSAQREREHLEKKKQQDAHMEKKSDNRLSKRLSSAWDRLIRRNTPRNEQGVSHERGVPGTGPEDSVPAPEGNRHLNIER